MTLDLVGADPSWSLSAPQTIDLVIEEPEIVTIQFILQKLTAIINPGIASIFGNLKTITRRESEGSIAVAKSFNSPTAISNYNIKFPWNNKWLLIDNLNTTISLTNPNSMLPFLPDNIQIILSAKLIGRNT